MVIQNTRQLRIQKTESSFTRRSAVLSRASSARQPDFNTLWNTSIPCGTPQSSTAERTSGAFRGGVVGVNRQIGDQLPVNPCPIGRLFALLGMEHGQGERRITLLLSDRRQDVNAAVSDLDSCRADMALAFANLNMALPAHLPALPLIVSPM